jgi:hypothetical protein
VALSSTTAPSPSITSTCSQTPFKNTSLPFEIPAIISKGKGKSKLLLNDDDLPLVQLKKLKTDKQVSDSSISDSSDIESAAFSLIKLHGDQFYKGPVHKFLTSPILDSHGKFVDFMPPYGGGFDARGMEFHPGWFCCCCSWCWCWPHFSQQGGLSTCCLWSLFSFAGASFC